MKYDLCIIGGAGHVGLPLGVAFANAGAKTVLLDTNVEVLNQISSGNFPFMEKGGEAALKTALRAKTLFTSSEPEVIGQSDVVIMVIGTPVDEHLAPNLHGLMKVVESYSSHFRNGQIVILRSTVFPGTSERLQRYFEKKGLNIGVSFCPERIVEGKALEELSSLPQIVSGFDRKTIKKVSALFARLTKRKIVVMEPIEAELAKLFSNAWRYLTFAVANEFFVIATEHGLDYHKIYRGMTEDYPRMTLPRPGFAAGPCLLKDTMQLAAFHSSNFFLGHAAMSVNEKLPAVVLRQLEKKMPDLHDKTIGILGMAFKAESDDIRESLSYKLRKIALTKADQVLCHDFFVQDERLVPLDKLLKESDAVILVAPHKGYAKIDPKKYPKKVFIDIWDFWPRR
ncbi:MAG: nucleotide sugar dehydrogenase [Candidatus Taylorbacteria bacterium]|nr:nucleotide sugar dehydrogenase [Candidatus Taylorbacteria bacterium]